MDFYYFVFYSFSVYGISCLITKENGPYDVFNRLREAFKPNTENPKDFDYLLKRTLKGNIYSVLTCPYCFGMWVSIFILLPNLVLNFNLEGLYEYLIMVMAIYGFHYFLLEKVSYE